VIASCARAVTGPSAFLKRARESVHKLRKSAVINIWLDPREYAPGTKNQTMYK
jgi:acetolactate synthase I/II/III large subunit